MKALPIIAIFPLMIPAILPVILQPKDATELLLHGPAGVSAISFVFALVFVIIRHFRPQNADPERSMYKPSALMFVLGFGVIMASMFLLSVEFQFNRYRHLQSIKLHSTRAIANVERLYNSSCDRSGCVVSAKYNYVALSGGRRLPTWFTGRAELARDNDPDDKSVSYARSTGHIPIMYDQLNPEKSEPNFGNVLSQENDPKIFISRVKSVGLRLLIGFVMFASLMALSSHIQSQRAPKSTGSNSA